MAAKKVDALEERIEGEMNQIKETVEEKMSSMEGQVADLWDMMKKMLEFQTQSAASDIKGPAAKNADSEIHWEEEEVEIVEGSRGRPHLEPFQREERGGRYGKRKGYGGVEPRGAGWEHWGGGDFMGAGKLFLKIGEGILKGDWDRAEQGKIGRHGGVQAHGRGETMEDYGGMVRIGR
ncbi:hypothetical protein KFK09_020697 [Dendrobium nobile]|uniref:Uncharacterized protein n=1 Tax=Dendrobium nobile TaxID=94219 RepID=A0A8T3AM14_DENNO|nr:hypothetical protein KFK09_020697 [Dendrobium nobile]